jgi:heme exporter protein CcmD
MMGLNWGIYAPYIFSSLGLCAVILAWNIVQPLHEWRKWQALKRQE